MNFEAIEDFVTARLEGDNTLKVLADSYVLPDTVSDFKDPHPKGIVYVVFTKQKFDETQSVGETTQHNTGILTLSLKSRKRRGQGGVYEIARLVEDILQGLHVPDAGALSLGELEFSSYDNNIWEYTITCSFRSLRVQGPKNMLPSDDVTDGEEVYYNSHLTNIP